MGRIEGRSVDFLYGTKGARVSASHLSDVIKGIPNSVRRVQFIQESIGAVLLNVEVDRAIFTAEHLMKLESATRYRFGSDADIKICIVDQIGLAASGKFRMIENLVDRERK